MILYYDNYIIEQPWLSNTVKSISDIRKTDSIYKGTKRLEISKYTLASYKIYPWTKVIIKVDAENKYDKEDFLKFAREIFPEAEIITHRSDNQKEYCKTISEIYKLDDDWVFYIPNNDHPMIINDINYIHKLLWLATEYKKKYKYVSINFSMYSENYNKMHNNFYKNTKEKYDTDLARIILCKNGYITSSQIVNKDLLKHLYCSRDFGDKRIIRMEDVAGLVQADDHIVILPKREICAHFDGYSHTFRRNDQISPDQVPPLFIPKGFFEKNIKIAYGYKEYREGWTNINPSAKYYSFRNEKNITDLKIGLDDIPLFWRERVSELDINHDADIKRLEKDRDEHFALLKNPWKDLSIRIKNRMISFLFFDIYVNIVMFIKYIFKTN